MHVSKSVSYRKRLILERFFNKLNKFRAVVLWFGYEMACILMMPFWDVVDTLGERASLEEVAHKGHPFQGHTQPLVPASPFDSLLLPPMTKPLENQSRYSVTVMKGLLTIASDHQ